MNPLHRSDTRLAIDMGQRLLRAVEARVRRGSIDVLRAISVEAPDTLDTSDPVAVGAWMRDALAAAGIETNRATFAVNREAASHKRLVLATTHAEDFADMTRLAMLRELGAAAEGVEIDFVPAGIEDGGTVVHALAVPRREIDFIRRMAEQARVRVARISLRTFGTAALLETLDDGAPDDSLRLAIDWTGEGLELCFVSGGQVRHSRGAELKYQRDAGAAAESAVTEVRRSWAAWRLSQPEVTVAKSIVFGEREVVRRIAGGVEDAVGPIVELASHPRVHGRTEAIDSCWPLAGMLLEQSLRRPRFDVAAPRRAPDLAARRRMRAYAAVGAIGISLLAGWTIGAKDLGALKARAVDLGEKAEGAKAESQRFKREYFRAAHLAAWEEAAPHWLDLLVDVGAFAPDQTRVVFDLFNGTLDAGTVRLVKEQDKATRIAVRRPTRVTVEGEARERTAVDGLREAFLKDQRFSLESPGTDRVGGRRLPMPFTFILRPGGAAPGAATGSGAGTSSGTAAPAGAGAGA
ncbi:MAG: hypothetical protein FJ253_01310 [Phycisphaerae bacterium]|nr:hypothetical protein [Phycisphaerae bacterium]